MPLDRYDKAWVEDQIRKTRGEIQRQISKETLVLSADALAEELALPIAPVKFIGPFTDAYDTADGLTGPFFFYAAGGSGGSEAISADGLLKSEANQGNGVYRCWSECGRIGGAFLLPTADFAIETAVTALDNSNVWAGGSIGVDDRNAGAASTDWFIDSGTAVIGYHLSAGGGTERVYWKASGALGWADVSYTPTVAQPVYLRIEYDHATTTVTFKYKGDAEGSWTTGASFNVGAGYWGAKMDAMVIINSLGGGGTGVFSATFDYMSIEYTPTDITDYFGVIPTESFPGFQKNWVYIKREDDTHVNDGIDPDEIGDWLTLVSIDTGTEIRWNSTTEEWEIFRHPPTLHSLKDATVHTQDLPHDNLVDVTSDQHHAKLHDMDDDTHHNSPGITEDNFASGDAAGFPTRDSTYNATSFMLMTEMPPVNYGAKLMAYFLHCAQETD